MANNPGTYNQQYAINEAGLDQLCTASRNRCTPSAPLGVNWINGFGTPVSTAPGATSTLTAANLLTGIITQSPSTANTSTFDTAANLVLAVNTIGGGGGAVVGDVIQCLLVNGNGTNAITLQIGTGGAFDGNNANRSIPVNTSKFCYVRLNNVTAGSEAYTVYF